MQAPSLLNRLAQSPAWRLEVAPLGNERYAEKALLQTPVWDGRAEGVSAVVVCSEEQRQWARRALPAVRTIWAAHCSLPGIVPPSVIAEGLDVVTFTHRNRRVLAARHPSLRMFTLTPAYQPTPRWQWMRGRCWTMCSRPKERRPDWNAGAQAAINHALKHMGFSYSLYGEGQPGGFLAGNARRYVEETSSCYLGRAMDNSGMGLVEHECWEIGSPVVARWAGDLYDGISQERMNADLLACLQDETVAKAHADLGMQYLRNWHSQRRMDESIATLLDG